jgi:predicted nucleotidyltransferase
MTFEKLKISWRLKTLEQQREAEVRRARLAEAGPVFERFGIRKVVLFGSVAGGRSAVGSDIDLLVLPLAGAQYWDFKRALEEAWTYPVDLYTQDDDPIFVNKILTRGQVVYES